MNPAIEYELPGVLSGSPWVFPVDMVFRLGVGAGVDPMDPTDDGSSGETGLGTLCDPCLDNATASTRASPKSLIGSSISLSAVVSLGVAVVTQPNVTVPYYLCRATGDDTLLAR